MVPFLDLTRQYRKIKKEIFSATQRVYEKGRFILGEEVSNFEKEFSHYCGVRYGVGVGSGTDALYLALKTAGIGEGDEVVTVANSFVATALAISFTGSQSIGTSFEAPRSKRKRAKDQGHSPCAPLWPSGGDGFNNGNCKSL